MRIIHCEDEDVANTVMKACEDAIASIRPIIAQRKWVVDRSRPDFEPRFDYHLQILALSNAGVPNIVYMPDAVPEDIQKVREAGREANLIIVTTGHKYL